MTAAAAITGVQVGASIVATRFVIAHIGPGSLALLRYAIGFLCLLPLALRGGRPRFAARDVAPIALLGIAQFGVLIMLLNYGLRTVASARGALIFATFPLLTMLVAAALGAEGLTVARTLGVLLSLGGVGCALGESALQRGPGGHAWIGEAVVLLSALVGAVCSVLYRPYLARYGALPVSAFAMLASVAFLLAPAGAEGFFSAPPVLGPLGWLAVLLIGVGSGGGYYLWLWALQHGSPTRVTVFLALSPITATLLGGLLLGEPISALAGLGVALVSAGLWLATRAGSRMLH
ncbi:MAG TPA: DMT family transporter [Methylomirabilota bacterium]|nr:DMT family transporter [Methylomirabilota bacterium]